VASPRSCGWLPVSFVVVFFKIPLHTSCATGASAVDRRVVVAMAMGGTCCLWVCALQLQRISYLVLRWISFAFSYFSDVARFVPGRSTDRVLS